MIHHLSHSTIQDFLACPRRFEWRRLRRLRKTSKTQALRLGARFHEGLDALKTGTPVETVIAEIWRAYDDIPSAIRDVDAWWLEREICARLIAGWATFSDPFDVVASEHDFEVPIRNPATGYPSRRFKLRGIFDGLIRLADGRIAILEHKTTSQSLDPSGDYIRRLRVDSQISRYFLAARELGIDVQTVVYDITRKPSIRPKRPTKKDVATLRETRIYHEQEISHVPEEIDRETPEMYGARLTADIVADPSRYFLRLEIPRLERDLDEAALELWAEQRTIARTLRSGRFVRNTAACLSPYRCEFADLCLTGTSPDHLAPGEVPDGYQFQPPKEKTS